MADDSSVPLNRTGDPSPVQRDCSDSRRHPGAASAMTAEDHLHQGNRGGVMGSIGADSRRPSSPLWPWNRVARGSGYCTGGSICMWDDDSATCPASLCLLALTQTIGEWHG
jgi:hypothetical protein